VAGVFLPAGTAIGHNIFGLMMSDEIFGPDPDGFRPERFLEVDGDKKAEMERVVELAFGSGRWMCAGKLVAFTQLYKALFELLTTFDMQLLCPGGRVWREESAIFWNQSNVRINPSFPKSIQAGSVLIQTEFGSKPNQS